MNGELSRPSREEGGLTTMRHMMVVLMLLVAVAAFGANAYDRGVAAYNAGDKVAAQLALDEFVLGGGVNANAYILLGELAKGRGEIAKAGEWYSKAAKTAKAGSKLRCVGLRCYIYTLTKTWSDAGIKDGDEAAVALEKEFAEDGDARMCRATWWGRRQFELLKAGDAKGSIPFGEKSIVARQDLPLFANNLAVAYCDMAGGVSGAEAKVLAQKALDLLAKYKVEGKLADTKARAEQIIARAK